MAKYECPICGEEFESEKPDSYTTCGSERCEAQIAPLRKLYNHAVSEAEKKAKK